LRDADAEHAELGRRQAILVKDVPFKGSQSFVFIAVVLSSGILRSPQPAPLGQQGGEAFRGRSREAGG
jgi:hypothetical protein